MDWAGWALFGLVATAVLTAVMIAAQLMGWTRLDPASGAHLGNYPQALTHAAFVRAALTLRDNTRHSPDEPGSSPAQTLDFNGMT